MSLAIYIVIYQCFDLRAIFSNDPKIVLFAKRVYKEKNEQRGFIKEPKDYYTFTLQIYINIINYVNKNKINK